MNPSKPDITRARDSNIPLKNNNLVNPDFDYDLDENTNNNYARDLEGE